ncbi:MAG: saccharopine dehydrogenase NADP-binding domain-containing protein [Myxococcota bacterium]|nr:saccharopine dehydrogenase NADP-binding domain-containing protein [Myxococcota bacterium]
MGKTYDLVLYGATGVTGRQMCKHLISHAPRSLRWAVAGRNARKLEALLAGLSSGGGPDVLIADSEDHASVEAMIRETRVLLHAAGPYAVHGEAFFHACIEAGTDYLDIGGETFFLQRMIERHHARAAKAGVRLIPVAGYEALPFDLATLLAVRTLRERHDAACQEVKVVVSFETQGAGADDGLSGGSVGTMKNILAMDDEGVYDDPACLLPPSARTAELRRRNAVSYQPRLDPDVDAVTGPLFPAPYLNVPVVLRSAFLYGEAGEPYGPAFRYREATSLGSVVSQRPLQWIGASLLGASYFGLSTLFRKELRFARRAVKGALDLVGPAPGQGPSDAALDGMDYWLDVFALSERDDLVHGRLFGRGHPGYKSTATMAAEAALALTLDRDRLPAFDGIVTPATGLGLAVRDRLKTAGLEMAMA